MTEFFPDVQKIKYEGPKSRNPLAFKHYNAKEKVLGKTMAEHLRFSVCYWHTFKGVASDPFGPGTIQRKYNDSSDPMKVAEMTLQAAFEFYDKLGVQFWCFHDRGHRPGSRDAGRIQQAARPHRQAGRQAPTRQQHQAPVGHRQPLLQPSLHGRRLDQPFAGDLRLRPPPR